MITRRPLARKLSTFLALSTLVVLTACSPQRLVDRGRPTRAFDKVARQLERRGDAKPRALAAMASAYMTLQGRDRATYERVGASGDAARWEPVVEVLERMQARRARLDRVRGVAKRIVRVETAGEPSYATLLVEARREAAAHLSALATSRLEMARGGGSKWAAREAYDLLSRRRRYAADDAYHRGLRGEARDLGTVRVALVADGSASRAAQEALAGKYAERLAADEWTYVVPAGGGALITGADFELELLVARARVGSPEERCDVEEHARVIEVEKTCGRDTLGQPIVCTEEVRVTGRTITTRRVRSSSAVASVTLREAGGAELWSHTVRGTFAWASEGTAYEGDARALASGCPPTQRSADSPPAGAAMRQEAYRALGRRLPRVDFEAFLPHGTLASR